MQLGNRNHSYVSRSFHRSTFYPPSWTSSASLPRRFATTDDTDTTETFLVASEDIRATGTAASIPMFLALLEQQPGAGRRVWCGQAASLAQSFDVDRFTVLFAVASLRLGRHSLLLEAGDIERLRLCGVDWPITGWGLDEVGRAMLLILAATHVSRADLDYLVAMCYRCGDTRERTAVLRALPCLPNSEDFLSLAAAASLNDVEPIFEAIGCENPYPALNFPELNFNHMVFKVLSLGISLRRILGLHRRISRELIRRAEEYARDRSATGRTVPRDVAYLSELS